MGYQCRSFHGAAGSASDVDAMTISSSEFMWRLLPVATKANDGLGEGWKRKPAPAVLSCASSPPRTWPWCVQELRSCGSLLVLSWVCR